MKTYMLRLYGSVVFSGWTKEITAPNVTRALEAAFSELQYFPQITSIEVFNAADGKYVGKASCSRQAVYQPAEI